MILLFILFIKYFFFGIGLTDESETASLIRSINVPEETYYIVPEGK